MILFCYRYLKCQILDNAAYFDHGFISGQQKTSYKVLSLSQSFSKQINYPGGTITATFIIPFGYEYIDAGIRGISFNYSGGGLSGTPTIGFNGVDTITFSAYASGNWGDNTTITGTVTLTVFVIDKT